MEKLNITRKEEDFYKLEINDKGDYVEFDLLDINLPNSIMKAGEEIEKAEKDFREKVLKLNDELKDNDMELTKKIMELAQAKFERERKAFDMFLGEGTCKKIFGDKNYENMFDDLMNGLEPHFDNMKINMEKIKERLKDKYKLKSKDVM